MEWKDGREEEMKEKRKVREEGREARSEFNYVFIT